ncbi:aldehyde dehydrogenase [Advenella kashmirensis]
MQRYLMLIDGADVPSASGEFFLSDNPYTGQNWAEIARGDVRDVDQAIKAAHTAFNQGPWPELTASARGLLLYRLADLIEANAEHLAAIEVMDNGKLLAEMAGQLNYLPAWFRYFGGLADKIEGAVIPLDKKGYLNFTKHEPMGVVAVITPWNSPLMLLAWKIAPALAAGCTVVIKPSEFTSASTLEFAKLFEQAGFPKGVVNVVTGFGSDVGAALVEHPLVAKVSFTGADGTGRRINQAAAASFKHVSLELGGKSPNIVFEDADLDAALSGVVSGIFAATGQTCIAGSRLLVQQDIHDVFVDKLVKMASAAKLGDPTNPDTQIGPICTEPQYNKVLDYIRIATEDGATLLLGGKPASPQPAAGGRFIEPTIFGNVRSSMRIAQEEVFGPLLAILPFSDENEALEIANDVRFGLAAGVWTKDMVKALRMSERLKAGTVWINTYRAISVMSPFGGYKDSGLGRENGSAAIREYLVTKSIWINSGAETANPFVMR